MSEHIVEFYQEEGEVVYVPDNWGHALINLEPCTCPVHPLRFLSREDTAGPRVNSALDSTGPLGGAVAYI